MWARVASLLVGIWVTAAPAVLQYGDPGRTGDHIVGPLAASAAIVAMSQAVRGVRWLETAAGAALVIAPWPLGYPAVLALHSFTAEGLSSDLTRIAPSASTVQLNRGRGRPFSTAS